MAGGMEELFRAHWPLVVGYLARRTGSTTLAEELAQETFYGRLALSWAGEGARRSPGSWPRTATRCFRKEDGAIKIVLET